ncbi:unnamed protein product [Parnassius apollo]|uniref:(apollo) hypothetical protein n=1 Tax=Parnassius apollo TaxID=110799 RepID=A0A8S3YBJ3_PARAO|nr:unnamed protein product [Parnassius apollo]
MRPEEIENILKRLENGEISEDDSTDNEDDIDYYSSQRDRLMELDDEEDVVQRNRLGKSCKLPEKREIMKSNVPRGTYHENVASHEGLELSVTSWKDNKQKIYGGEENKKQSCMSYL